MKPADRWADIIQHLRNADFCKTVKYDEQQLRADRTNCDPRILVFERRLVARLAEMGIPFFCHTAKRTLQEQQRLHDAGFSKLPAGKGAHNHGFAVDIIHSQYGWEIGDERWPFIGHIGKEVADSLSLKVTWGGDWKDPWDPAHWELKDWRELVPDL